MTMKKIKSASATVRGVERKKMDKSKYNMNNRNNKFGSKKVKKRIRIIIIKSNKNIKTTNRI